MDRNRWALLGLVLLAGCKEKGAEPVPGASRVASDAVDAGWALTLPMVDGYLRYQRALLIQAGKLQPPAWDGGLRKFEEQAVEQRADLEERARRDAGLSPDDVQRIELMLSRTAARRMTFRLMRMGEKTPELPVVDPAEPGAVQIEEAVAAQQKMKKALEEMPDERRAFGNANIDVLLKREDELLKNWALMMEVPELAQSRR